MRQDSESYAKKPGNNLLHLLRRLSSYAEEPRDQIILKLILETGCTPKEISRIRKEDFEFTTCSMTIGAKGRRRTVKISLELSLLLNSFIGQRQISRYVFSTRQSSKISTRRISQLVARDTSALAGNEITPRELRKISIKASFSRTKSLAKTKKISGLKGLVEKEHLTAEQLKKINESIKDSQHKIILGILCETGCLPSELASIKAEDVDFQNNHIIFRADNTRNRQERISKISKELGLQIKLFVDEKGMPANGFLFSTRQSGQISDKRIFQLVRKYSEMAGLKKISPRTIRNTSVALALEKGISEEDIKSQLGIKHLDMSHFGLLRAGKRTIKEESKNNG